MKKQVCKPKRLFLSVLQLFLLAFAVQAQVARKDVQTSFNVKEGASIIANTKYSEVEILSWEKDVVDIVAEMEVKAPTRARAEECLRKINVALRASGDQILIDTELQEGWSKNARVKIRIIVQAPAYVNLNLNHAYGDVFVQELTGRVMLDLRYGNFKAGRLLRKASPCNRMDLAYSDAEIEEAGCLDLELAYSEIELGYAESVDAESKYSKILGGGVGELYAKGAYDKYRFDEVGSFRAELKYSGVKIAFLKKSFELETKYTNVKLEELSPDFELLSANLAYGNIFAGIPGGAAYSVNAEARYGSVTLDEAGQLSRSNERNVQRVWGTVGSNPKSRIELFSKYGNISLE